MLSPPREPATSELVESPEKTRRGLSDGERILLLHHHWAPASTAYHLPVALAISGPLDDAALALALRRLGERHDILGSTFHDDGERSWREVRRAARPRLETRDARRISATELRRELETEARRPFDLERRPPLRAKLFRRSTGGVLLLVVHHVAADFGALTCLVHELGRFYAAALGGEAPRLAEIEPALRPAERPAAVDRAFWKARLTPLPPPLELPADRPARTRVEDAGGACGSALPAVVAQAVRGLARELDTTLYVTLLASFQAFLSRICGRREFLLGTPVQARANGRRPAIGHRVELLPVRAELAGDPAFDRMVRRVRHQVLEMLGHRRISFFELAELAGEPSQERPPGFFQVTMVLERAPSAELQPLAGAMLGRRAGGLRFGPLDAEVLPLPERASAFDLSLIVGELDGTVVARLRYRTQLFDDPTARRWLGHWQVLLRAALENPSRALSELPLLTPAQRHQLSVEWQGRSSAGAVAAAALADDDLYRLFEGSAKRTPDAVALVDGSRQVTYENLAARVSRLARRLRRAGIAGEMPAGLCLENGAELWLATLAVLAAGGHFVPLDPAHPAARLERLLGATGARLVVTTSTLVDRLGAWSGRRLLLDRPAPTGRDQETDDRAAGGRTAGWADRLAYVVHTSGSSGEPKGVMASHRGAATYLLDYLERAGLGPGDRVLQIAANSFDSSLRDGLGPLLAGARVITASRRQRLDPGLLLDAIQRHRITALPSVVPSLLPGLLAEAAGRRWRSPLRRLLLAGEKLLPDRARQVGRLLAPGGRAVNQYGPTETVCTASHAAIETLPVGRFADLGRPHDHRSLHLLAAGLRPVPIGVTGHVHLGGGGLARGYLGRPAATAAAFLPDPFSRRSGSRLYATGDLGQHLPDGRLEFRGRLDRQLKVRGVRVEPAEIEAVLVRHPAIRETAVELHEPAAGEPRLVAYLASHPGHRPPAAGELRRWLETTLPAALHPSAMVFLEVLPRTASGKLDRRALPPPSAERPALDAEFIAPRNAIERRIAELWQELLGLDRVGSNDRFFDLGGHSLLLLRLRLELRRRFGHELSIADLFRFPTVAALARRLTRGETAGDGAAAGRGRLLRTRAIGAQRRARVAARGQVSTDDG